MKGAFNYIQPKNIQNQNIITIPIPVYSNFLPQNYNLNILNTLKSLPTQNPNYIINIPAINYYNNLLQNYHFFLNPNNLFKSGFNQLQIPEISNSNNNNIKKKKLSIDKDKDSTSSNSSKKEVNVNESNSNSSNSNNINNNTVNSLKTLLGKKKKRITKMCTDCPHKFAVHYAKGMCSNCYHSRGRSKKPWNCPHVNKTHYALGLCQNCYQMNYIKKQCFNLNEVGKEKSNLIKIDEENKENYDEEKIIDELLLKEKENKNELEIEQKDFTIKK
jgi:hypothetical protein